MRKVVLFGVLVIALFMTGCSKKKELVCSQSMTNVDIKMILGYEDDKLSSMEFREVVNLSTYSDNDIDKLRSQDLCSLAKQSVGQMAEAFINCKQKISGKELILTGEFELEKIPNSEVGINKSMDEAKEYFEQKGLKCEK